jgi:transposase InsO family protein
MMLHANAKTCPKSRTLIASRVLEEGWTLQAAAEAAGCSVRTAAKWVARFRAGDEQLADRSSRPRRSPTRLPASLVQAIETLRRVRMTAAEIAEILGLALSTVSLWLRRIGLGKRSRLEPPEPPNRYERRHPGELVHVDIKKLGRIMAAGHRVTGERASQKRIRRQGRRIGVAGWEYVHVMVDDHSRLACVEVLADERGRTAVGFLRRARSWFGERGVKIKRVMTDNGACYRWGGWSTACRELGMRHVRTRPYRPRTNGKAERFIQTLLDEWAYARVYGSSAERTAALPLFLTRYNFRRPHGSLGKKAPATRLNNLVGNYS